MKGSKRKQMPCVIECPCFRSQAGSAEMQGPHLQPGFSLPPVKVNAVQQGFPEPHGIVNSHAKPLTNEQITSPPLCEDLWGVTTGYI